MRTWTKLLVVALCLIMVLCLTPAKSADAKPTAPPPSPVKRWWKQVAGNWAIQLRGPEIHPLPCTLSPTKHFNVEVFHKTAVTKGRWGKPVFNAHVGYYHEGTNKCWALYVTPNNTCLKTCNGRSGLKQMYVDALLIVLGVGVATWLLYLLAEVMVVGTLVLLPGPP
jgi:hypothetical protein